MPTNTTNEVLIAIENWYALLPMDCIGLLKSYKQYSFLSILALTSFERAGKLLNQDSNSNLEDKTLSNEDMKKQ